MKKRYLISIIGLVLCGCDNNANYYAITPIKEEDLRVNDIYEAVGKLKSLNNYTLSITLTDSEGSVDYDNIYAEKYYYSNYPHDEKGFIQDTNGVYRVNMYENHLIASELFVDQDNKPYTDLWKSKLVPSFKDFSQENYLNAKNQKTFKITNKKEKLLLLDILEVPQTYYTSLQDCSFSLSDNTMNSLNINVQFDSGINFQGVFNSFGQSESSEILDFKAENKTFTTLHSDLLKAKELFALNNYKRTCYRNEDPNGQIIGYEWFHPNYWYGDFIKANLTSDELYTEQGYLGLEKKVKNNVKYDGAYLFFLDETYENCQLFTTYPAFTTNISSLVDIMNYPSKMVMWDYNLQFFEYVPDQTEYPGKNLFVTSDPYIINDWITNFQINLSTDDGSTAYIHDLRIITDIYDDPKDSTITFQFDYNINGTVYGLQREFIDFNNANIPVMDDLYNSFENQ